MRPQRAAAPAREPAPRAAAAGVIEASETAEAAQRASTLLRSIVVVVVAGLVLLWLTETLSSYRNLQLADGAYYFCVLAGLTVLAGASGAAWALSYWQYRDPPLPRAAR